MLQDNQVVIINVSFTIWIHQFDKGMYLWICRHCVGCEMDFYRLKYIKSYFSVMSLHPAPLNKVYLMSLHLVSFSVCLYPCPSPVQFPVSSTLPLHPGCCCLPTTLRSTAIICTVCGWLSPTLRAESIWPSTTSAWRNSLTSSRSRMEER